MPRRTVRRRASTDASNDPLALFPRRNEHGDPDRLKIGPLEQEVVQPGVDLERLAVRRLRERPPVHRDIHIEQIRLGHILGDDHNRRDACLHLVQPPCAIARDERTASILGAHTKLVASREELRVTTVALPLNVSIGARRRRRRVGGARRGKPSRKDQSARESHRLSLSVALAARSGNEGDARSATATRDPLVISFRPQSPQPASIHAPTAATPASSGRCVSNGGICWLKSTPSTPSRTLMR